MAEENGGFLDLILQQCAANLPEPWYPADHVRSTGISRASLDADLDRLRMAGLIHLTEWVKGKGQGYTLTEEGQRALQNPRLLALLQANKWTPSAASIIHRDPYALETGQPTRGDKVHAALDNRSRPIITVLLIIANIGVFLLGLGLTIEAGVSANEYLGFNNLVGGRVNGKILEIQHRIGALSGGDLVSGDWRGWLRLMSNCFVHFGLIHLAVNMYCLYAIGPFLEHIWGRARFLVLYLISGCAGSCAMVVSNPDILGAGASGAIWGILASLPAWIMINRRFISRTWASNMMRQLLFLFILNVAISLAPGISAAAHFGGGAAGVVIALLLNEERFGSGASRILAGLGILATPVLCVGLVMKAQSKDDQWGRVAVWKYQLLPKLAQMDAVMHEAKQLYVDEIAPRLWFGTGTASEGANARLVENIDARGRELKEMVNLLESAGSGRTLDQERSWSALHDEINQLSNLLEVSRNCLSEGKDCSDETKEEVFRRARKLKLQDPRIQVGS